MALRRVQAVGLFVSSLLLAGGLVGARGLLPLAILLAGGACLVAVLRPAWIVAAWLALVPLIGPAQLKAGGLPAVTAPRLMLALALVSAFFAAIRGARPRVPVVLPAIAYIAATLVSYELQTAHQSLDGVSYVNSIVLSFLPALPLMLIPFSRRDLHRIVGIFTATALVITVAAFQEHRTKVNLWSSDIPHNVLYRAAGPFEHPLVLAAFLSLGTLPLFDVAMTHPRRRLRIAAAAAAALVSAGNYFTYSRGPLIGLAAGVLFLVFRYRRLFSLELFALAGAGAYAAHSVMANTAAITRLGSGDTLQIRISLYQAAWTLFKQHWVFGLGVRGFGHALGSALPADLAGQQWSAVDNFYLQVLVEAGVVGALAFAGVVIVSLRAVLRSDRSDALHRIGGAIVIATLVVALDFDLFDFPILAAVFFLGLRLVTAPRQDEATESRGSGPQGTGVPEVIPTG